MRPIAIVLFIVILLAGCSRTPEEQRIRNAITTMQQAVQAHQPRAFMSYVSADSAGQDGTIDHEALANILRAEVLRNDQVNVILGPIDVQMQGSRATVHVTVTIVGGSGGPLPEHGAVYAITSGWKKDGSDWRCYNASWVE